VNAFRGTVGWATQKNVYRLYCQQELTAFDLVVKMDKGEEDEEVYIGIVEWNGQEYRMSNTMSGGSFVYFDDSITAGLMRQHIVDQEGTAYVFSERHTIMPVDKVVYWGSEKLKEAIISRGGEEYTTTVSLSNIGRWKTGMRYFAAYHLLYFPSMIAALAKWGQRNGMLDIIEDIDEIWNIRPLFSSAQYDEDDVMFYSEEAQGELVGDDSGFQKSILYQQRAALWELFEEENPLAYLPEKKTGKYAMSSDSLAGAINFGMGEWKEPQLIAIESVPVPVYDVTDNNGWPIKQTIIVNWFDTEEQALAFVAQSDNVVAEAKSGKKLPEAWAGMLTEWESAVVDVKARFDSSDKVDKDTYEILSVTPEELKEWW